MNGNLIVKNASQVVTCSGFKAKQGREMSDLAIIENGAVIIKAGNILIITDLGEGLVQYGKTPYNQG